MKCGYCKKTRSRKCKKTVLDQIQTLKDPEAIKKAETMLCQKKEIIWTSYEYVNYHNSCMLLVKTVGDLGLWVSFSFWGKKRSNFIGDK